MPNSPERNGNTATIGWDFTHDGVGDNFPAVKLTSLRAPTLVLNQDGNYEALNIDHDDSGTDATVKIVRDGDNAARIFGLSIDVDNAGTNGLVGGIDLSSFAADEPLFKVPVDTDVSSGTISARYAVRMNTTTYYVKLYAES